MGRTGQRELASRFRFGAYSRSERAKIVDRDGHAHRVPVSSASEPAHTRP